jgi:plasmid stability protein
MSTLTIRKIDDALKSDLRRKAAANDRSMEEEARVALRDWVKAPNASATYGLGTEIRKIVEAHGGGYDLELPPRGPARPLPDIFDDEE